MKRCFALVSFLVLASILISGCGETANGLNKDLKRITKGIKTVFVTEN